MATVQTCPQELPLVFKAKPHSYFSNKTARIIGPELYRLAGNKTDLTGTKPDVVVSAATDESNPLHPYFEWDNEKAGHAHRLQQARVMLNAIELEVLDGNHKKVRLPAFESLRVSTGTSKERRYFSLPQITSSRDMTERYVQQAKDDLFAFRTRYKKCEKIAEFRSTFARVFRAIDVLGERPRRPQKKAA